MYLKAREKDFSFNDETAYGPGGFSDSALNPCQYNSNMSAYYTHSQTLIDGYVQLDPLTLCDLHLFKLTELVAFSEKVFSLSIPLIHSDGPLPLRGAMKLTK